MDDEGDDIEIEEMNFGDLKEMIEDSKMDSEALGRLEIDLTELEKELGEMGIDGDMEFEVIYNYEDYEGTYGSSMLQYLFGLEAMEVLPRGEAFKILSLSIEWPADILIEA